MATSWKFYLTPQKAWDAMYEDCERARISIDLEQFILDDDEVGRRFLNLFARKVREGVRVRVVLDMAGSYDLYESQRVREALDAGIEILFFNPISIWRLHTFTALFFRTHQKILIVDDTIGHTGGIGFRKSMQERRDTNLRIIGPVVQRMVYVFERMLAAARENRPARHRLPWQGDGEFQFLTDAPYPRRRYFYKAFRRAIRGARRSIILVTPYFVPNFAFLQTIRRAAHRSIAITLIIPVASDHPFVDHATMANIGVVLRAGARVFQYGPPFNHSKLAVVDDTWAMVGSSNLDSQSFKFNHEANVVSTNKDFVREVARYIESDRAQSRELTLAEWEARPFSWKLVELLTWPIHGFF